MFLSLVVTELVSAVKSSQTMAVAPLSKAGVLRDSMLPFMSSKVTQAVKYLSAPSMVAGMWVGIDVGTTRCNRSR
jgi:hypothetical protein